MRLLPASFAIVLTSLISLSQALYFYLDGTTPRCFYEDLAKGTLVVGMSYSHKCMRLLALNLSPWFPKMPSKATTTRYPLDRILTFFYRNIQSGSLLAPSATVLGYSRTQHPLHRGRNLRQRPPRSNANHTVHLLKLALHLLSRRLRSTQTMFHAQWTCRHQCAWLVQ